MKNTIHQIYYNNSTDLSFIKDETVNLVVTSPPYPMIELWDNVFSENCNFPVNNISKNPKLVFEKIHLFLDKVWSEVNRVLKPNGFVCINIGDATRTFNNDFQIFMNHSKIIESFSKLGFYVLPTILWRKQTNSPNKFMGSGMLPAGAYVTLEHEYILIFRKGSKRSFKSENDKLLRQESAFFWEERNIWFSDLWDFKGTSQKLKKSTSRITSAAYPFELPYRLVNMYSVKGDTVLDPFLGTGTTMLAAIASERNSIGVEIDSSLSDEINHNIVFSKDSLNKRIAQRIEEHLIFINNHNGDIKYFNENHNFKVKTNQEKNIKIHNISDVYFNGTNYIAEYV